MLSRLGLSRTALATFAAGFGERRPPKASFDALQHHITLVWTASRLVSVRAEMEVLDCGDSL